MTVAFDMDHIHLRSLDPVAASLFYTDILGGVELSRAEAKTGLRVVVGLGGVNLFIEGFADATRTQAPAPHLGLEHFGLRVADLDQAVAVLRSKGATFAVEPKESRPGIKIAFINAPDGVQIELIERQPA